MGAKERKRERARSAGTSSAAGAIAPARSSSRRYAISTGAAKDAVCGPAMADVGAVEKLTARCAVEK